MLAADTSVSPLYVYCAQSILLLVNLALGVGYTMDYAELDRAGPGHTSYEVNIHCDQKALPEDETFGKFP